MHNKFYLCIAVLCALQCVGCAVDIPRTMYKQEETIQQLQQSNQDLTASIASLKKSQADLSSDIESLKQSLQALQGSIEQNNMKSERALAETRTLQQEVLSVLRAKEGQLGTVNAQIQSVDSGTQTPGAPPAQRPPNSISGNSIEGVWSPKPYQAQSQRKGTTPGAPGQGSLPQTAAVAQQSTAEWAYAEAYNTLKAGNYEGARKQFKQFLQDYKSSELAGNAQFWVGESFVKEKKYEEAIISFEDLVKSYPKSNKVPEGYYKQALCFLAINDSVAAKARLEMLLSEYPSSELADKAKQKLQELQQLPAADQEQ